MKKNVSVVISVHPDFDGRIWKQILSLSEARYRVNIISYWDKSRKNDIPDNINFYRFKKEDNKLKRLVFHQYHIFKMILKAKSGILHFHEIEVLPLMAVMRLLFKFNIIYDIHENYPIEFRERAPLPAVLKPVLYQLFDAIEKVLVKIIGNIVTVVPLQDERFKSASVRKVRVHNYATKKLADKAIDNYLGRKNSVIFIGSQHVNNGSLLYLEIAKKVLSLRRDIIFYNVDRFKGQVVFQKLVMDTIRQYGMEENFVFLPNTLPQDLMDNLNLATIAISPNLRVRQQIEGIHNKIYEYMAAGLPIIASDLPHQVEVIEKNRIGFCVPPESPEAFADKILYLVENKKEARKMGEKARQVFFDQFSWENEAEKMLNFYKELK